jgi:hypothetical protein
MSMKPRLIRILPIEERAKLEERLSDDRPTYTELASELRERGWDVKPGHVRNYALHLGLRTRRPTPLTKIDSILSPEHHKEYEALLADRRTTAAQARQWLLDHGYSVGGKSVGTHRQRFLVTLERVRESARLAGAMVDIARENGPAIMGDAMLLQCEQVLMQEFTRMQENGNVDSKKLSELCKSVVGTTSSRKTIETIRGEFEQQKRKAAQAAEDMVKTGASGKEVVDRVREMLGV